ncbi:MAG: VCBS repeat-containing protein, partial [Planctomycetes bacterium]|nr:VCBS repeat-containing protein [Planctomycetota bacterium]
MRLIMNHHSRLFGVTVSMLFTGIFVLSSASQCGLGSALVYAQEMTIVDDSFEDFSKGTLSDGGHNLYVASEGSIRTINRFDLNQDGYLDVIFNCTHNTYQMLPATVGHIEKDRTATDRPISVEGSQQVAAADLNRDGWADLVFCPNPIGVHHDRRFLSVAWGGPDGWVSERINSPLPMNSVVGVEIVDLNGDGWPDIAALGGSRWLPNQPEGRIIRIYLGSATGYSIVDVRDLGVVNARAIAAGDFDGNNARDLAVLRSDGKITIVWGEFSTDTNWNPARSDIELSFQDASCLAAADLNVDGRVDLVISRSSGLIGIVESKSDRTWNPVKDIPAFNATQITVADLDRDQKPELVLTQFDQARAAGGEQAGAGKSAQDLVRILWNESGTFSRDRITELAVPFSVATAAGDLDGDGNPDLVVAVHQGKTSFSSESQVWFGNGKREFTRSPSGFKTSGTLHVVVVPAEKRSAEPASTTEARELPARAVFCNSIGGELDENVPLHIFWGGKEGFDPERIWKLPFHSGYEASASDLNTDGFVDLIVLNSGHAGEHSHTDPTLGANIVWGGPEGIDKSPKRTVLKEHFLGTSSVSDLNRDGWLDLVLEPFAADPPGSKEKLFVYYGGRDGYSLDRRIALELDGYSQEHLVADFNHDNWLDIAVTTRSLDCIRILWGGEQGFSTTREQRLKISGPVGVDA